ncbi:hypothetical protein [Spirillospora sp. NBC_01491]|uniref:hypothetical protein n=1 Tax=Spirillospora sp. NBC_01491 TaxID=2976007 RepID=UPI002E35393D|nr:hypothetical protein [Spirillospora sp. NBC_01491]
MPGPARCPSNTFSLYDQVLDTTVLVDAVPERFRDRGGLDAYFASPTTGHASPDPMESRATAPATTSTHGR